VRKDSLAAAVGAAPGQQGMRDVHSPTQPAKERLLQVAFVGRWAVVGGYALGIGALYFGEHYWDSAGPVAVCLIGTVFAYALANAAHQHGEREFHRWWRREREIAEE
jgi:hypothetical protein